MRPVLFTIGGSEVYSHNFFLLLGLAAGILALYLEARRRKWPKGEAYPITLAAFAGGILGGRVSLLFFNGLDNAPIVLNFSMYNTQVGPGSILGAVAGAYIAGYIASRMIGRPGCACDAFAPAMALAIVIGRMGCFLSGEDGLGKPTTLPWGVQLPGQDHLVHPAPLYDAAFNLAWFGVLIALRDKPAMQNGNLLKFGVGGYALVRFFIEFVRNNRVMAFGLTGQQLFCLGLLGLLAGYYGYRWLQGKRKAVFAA